MALRLDGRLFGATLEDRLWNRVIRGEGCWTWLGTKNSKGYGQIDSEGKVLKVHRVSWELAFGPIPDGLWVLHHCDNPSCVRPDHLFLGTPMDNVLDRVKKGRTRTGCMRGEKNHWAVLTWDQVRAIRREGASGDSGAILARRYGVSPPTIYRILACLTWREEDSERGDG